MALPKDLIIKYKNIFNLFICPVSIVIQKMLKDFLQSGEFIKHLNKMRKIYSKKRNLIVDLLRDRKDIKIKGEDAGLSLVLEYPSFYKEDEIVLLAKKSGIRVNSLKSYGKSNKPSILLGFANLSLKEIEESISLLKEI